MSLSDIKDYPGKINISDEGIFKWTILQMIET